MKSDGLESWEAAVIWTAITNYDEEEYQALIKAYGPVEALQRMKTNNNSKTGRKKAHKIS